MKDSVVFAFGRFNPPTTGHEKLIEKVASVAKQKNADFMVFPSHSQNPKKDPLDFKTKVGFMKKMFPKYSKNIISKSNIKNAFQVASLLHEMGYKKAYMIAGSDRVSEFDGILNKYNGKEGRHGFYDFEGGIQIISAGERDENATGVTGMSASKMRAAAVANRYEDEKDPKTGKKIEGFKSGLPAKFEKTDGRKLFDAIRKAMKVESAFGDWLDDKDLFVEFWTSPLVYKIDDLDDDELFDYVYEEVSQKQIGDLEKFADRMLAKYDIDITFTRHFVDRMNDPRNNPEIKVAELQKFFKKIQKKKGAQIKANPDIEAVLKDMSNDLNLPVVINYKNGEFEVVHKTIMRKKNFSTTSKELKYESRKTQQDPDVKDKDGTQPKKYYAKDADGDEMSKATKEKRAAFFKKQANKPDDEKSSYKQAPGDANAKTKPSKYTKKYQQMFGEEIEGLKTKSEKSGISYSILKKVYDRGMAAWKSGHRPGTTPQQWAFARVNSFITGGKTRTTADADLWKQHKGKSESVDEAVSAAQQAAIAIAKKESGKYDKDGKKKDEDCWPGYKQVGMKKKGGKDVPNCVPEDFKMNPDREKELEKIAKDLPDDDFKKRYGDEWMQVKMATAMNMLKKKLGYQTESLSGAEKAPELPGGAGEWGTNTLRDTYLKDTPFMELVMTPKELAKYRDIINSRIKTKG